jgi:hypothetical protein
LTTKLDHPLKRELEIGGRRYTLTLSPEALVLVPKGRRKGLELKWLDLVSGDAALATALNASLALALPPAPAKKRDVAGITESRRRARKRPPASTKAAKTRPRSKAR